ncbi:FtsQ-type POTRA domain-containing protein [Sphingorhabdus sp. IMCC26285]|uniref:Cell division protein FtsQ n=1 Tax=Sphingorhabdus profundilacus TaxID=2509718 RepID=A0A6I4LWT6_9SPHN|nr:cell division protein FtsQ/DivIB [Sphingorhabdus profundilacus]MVZ97329.1 FtsQ-type POTRA domain-containing protein [Sphingorhabdus profundilacus]
MATKTRKSNVRRNAQPPRPRQKVQQISVMDRALRALPFSEEDIQRATTWLIIAALTVLAFAAAQWAGITTAAYLQYSEIAARAGFQVQRVEVTGMERVDQLKVYDLVLAEKDRAMPLVDIDKVRADLLQYGWIEDARVSRRLPDTLAVEIVERKPAAVWQRDGKYSLIDARGNVLENVQPGDAGTLPILNGADANQHAIALNALLDKASALKAQISGASWIGNRRWDLKFKSGETLALPEGESAAAEALLNFARMDGIHRLLGRDIIHFDLRDPERAYFRKVPKAEPVTTETSGPDSTNSGTQA